MGEIKEKVLELEKSIAEDQEKSRRECEKYQEIIKNCEEEKQFLEKILEDEQRECEELEVSFKNLDNFKRNSGFSKKRTREMCSFPAKTSRFSQKSRFFDKIRCFAAISLIIAPTADFRANEARILSFRRRVPGIKSFREQFNGFIEGKPREKEGFEQRIART